MVAALSHGKLLEAELGRRSKVGSPTRDTLERDLVDVERSLTETRRKRARLLDDTLAAVFTADELQAKAYELGQQEADLTARRDRLVSERRSLAEQANALQGALAFAERVRTGLTTLDDKGRAEFLQRVVRRAVVEGREPAYALTIYTVLPVDPASGPDDPSGSGHLPFGDRGGGSCRHEPDAKSTPVSYHLRHGMGALSPPAFARDRVVRMHLSDSESLLFVEHDVLGVRDRQEKVGPENGAWTKL